MEKETKDTKLNRKMWYIVTGIFLIALSIILVILLMLSSEIKITGNWSGLEISESLTCKTANTNYSIFSSNAEIESSIQINATFSQSEIDSIALIYIGNYTDAATAKTQSDVHEFDVNDSFGRNELESYALGARFSTNGTKAQMNLYATKSDLNNTTSKYFMLNTIPNGGIDVYKKRYESQDFTCEIIKDN